MDQVRHRYHEMVREWHPDKHRKNSKLNRKAEEVLREINQAFEELERASHNLEFAGSVPISNLAKSIFCSIGKFAAAPFLMLVAFARISICLPLELISEISVLLRTLVVFMAAVGTAALIIYAINSASARGTVQPAEQVELLSMKERLDSWADKKSQRTMLRSFSQSSSALDGAPTIIQYAIDCDLNGVSSEIRRDASVVSTRDGYGDTPLAWAAKRGCSELVDLLLAKGASADSRAENGYSPADWALKYGHKNIAIKLGARF